MSLESIRVVVAIDFGTSRSGFAYAFTVDRKVIGWTDWPGQSTAYPKTLTQLLYSPEGEVLEWGYLAPQRMAELRREADAAKYHLLRNFKMELHESTARSYRGPLIKQGGREYAVVDVISDYLRLLKEMAWRSIEESTAGHLREDEILWCLTVPAIWADTEKQIMRTAARGAGLIGTGPHEAERLLLVLEPEAAAIHCQEKDRASFGPGTRFMVVDCGGGTVDITAHEMAPGEGMKEVAAGTGGALGSSYVDKVFVESVLHAELGAELLDAYREEEPLEFLEMMTDWERLKCNFDPRSVLGASCLPFRPRLYRMLSTRFPETYEKLMDEGHDDGIYLEPAQVEAIFTPILDRIVEKVREELERMGEGGCDVLYLVGGFATSPVLRRRIRGEVESVVGKVVVPPLPGAAVVEGAVAFGLDPSLIRARRSRLTYGCGCEMPYEPGKDHEIRKVYAQELEEWFCDDRFRVYVQAGDVVEVDQCVRRTFSPVEEDQTEIVLDFFVTRKRDVRYIDEDGVWKIGSCQVEMADTRGGLDREVEVSMYFGKTEIEVKAVELETGKEHLTTLDFSPSFASDLLGEDA